MILSRALGYFLNTYPYISTTFIRREILAHEAAGIPVARFAVRTWAGELVDPCDIEEQRRTRILLDRGLRGLIWPVLREVAGNPVGFVRAIGQAVRLARQARSRRLHHIVYLCEAARLKQETTAQGVEHLHVHFSTNAATVALLSRTLGGPSYSFTVHGPDELPDLAVNGFVEKAASAQVVIAISEYCRGVLRKTLDAGVTTPVHVVRCGLDLDAFPESAGQADRQPGHLVCVGRLCPQKAQTTLIRAMARLKDTHGGAHLTLIGDGESRPEIETLVEEFGLADRVTLMGWGSGDVVREAVAQAHAFVLPSLAEGLPVAIMEALALQTPVISTRIAGIPELLDDSCGWVIEPGSVEQLSEALADCLNAAPSRLRAMGAAGRMRVVQQHDQTRTAADLYALIAGADTGAGAVAR